MHKTLFHSAICLCMVFATCFLQASAQQGSIAITPISIDAKVKAGASYTQNFTLTNNTGESLRFRCSASDVWYDEQNRRITGRAGTLPRSASLWIQFTPSEIIVACGATAVVRATITIPPNVTGSFYTVPVFETTPTDKPLIQNAAQTNLASASIGIRFRGLMMLTTDRGAEYNVEIMGARVSPPTASSEFELNVDLRNRGTAHAKARGAFAILDAAGRLVGRGTIEEKRFLPTQRDIIRGKWAGELVPGQYTCVVTLSYNRVGLEPHSLVHEISFEVK